MELTKSEEFVIVYAMVQGGEFRNLVYPDTQVLPKAHRNALNATTLKNLCSKGLLECVRGFPGSTNSRYRLTDAGRRLGRRLSRDGGKSL